jgi:SAM-dependent methyltransferase
MSGILGGRIGYEILRRLNKSAVTPARCDGSAYIGRSKVEALLGPDIWSTISGRAVIDFGCGEGDMTIEMAQQGAALVIGVVSDGATCFGEVEGGLNQMTIRRFVKLVEKSAFQFERFDAVPFFWSQHYDVAINYVGYASSWDEANVVGNIADRDCLVAYRKSGKTRAVATIYRDLQSLQAQVAMDRGDAQALDAVAMATAS